MRKVRRSGRIALFTIAVVALAILFVRVDAPSWGEPPAARLLPELPAYRQVEGQSITTYVGTLAQGGAILAGQPQLAATVAVLDSVIGCLQETGGMRARVYSHSQRPLEAGAIVIGDMSRLKDTGPILKCTAPAVLELETPGRSDVEPCIASYPLLKNGVEFQIVYVASNYSTCRDFCRALESCAVHL
jgi:hypothetical protein